jgi:hypothetical protein
MLRGNMQSPCPNHLYVALTRTTKHLTLFQSHKRPPLPFVKIGRYADIITYRSPDYGGFIIPPIKRVSKFVKFRNPKLIRHILSLFDISEIQQPSNSIYPDIVSKQYYGSIQISEDVSSINGLALDLYVAHKRGFDKLDYNFDENFVLSRFLRSVTYHKARDGNFISYNQITKYNWMKPSIFFELAVRCDNNIGKSAMFHKHAEKYIIPGVFRVEGECDALLDDSVFELKCVCSLSVDHYLQTIMYMWLFDRDTGYLYNAVDNSKYRIIPKTKESLVVTVQMLYDSHVNGVDNISDDDFINEAKSL